MKAGILIICGYALLLGYTAVGVGLASRFGSGINRTIALVMSVVALAALIVLGIGDHFHDLSDFYQVANRAPLPLNLWVIALGLALYQEQPSLTPTSSD